MVSKKFQKSYVGRIKLMTKQSSSLTKLPQDHDKPSKKPGGKAERPVFKPSRTLVISVVVGAIAFTTIQSNFNGLIHLKLDWNGGEVLIDTRQSSSESNH